MNKLLPCPFCGGNDIQIDEMESFWDKNETSWRVMCIDCIAETAGDTKEQAIAAWNRRAQPENEPLTLEELREMDRETVFVGESDFWLSGIGTVSVEDGGVFDPDDQDGYWPFDDYGEWLAYRTKPERSEG